LRSIYEVSEDPDVLAGERSVRSNMNSNTAEFGAYDFALAAVEPSSDLDPQ
jgi:hypothetical protein